MKLYYLYVRVYNKILKILLTVTFRIKYFPYVTVESGVYVKSGVRIIPFSRNLKIHLKRGSNIKNNVIIQGSGTLVIGERSYISSNTIIGVNQEIIIGDDVMISSNISIRDTDHKFDQTCVPMSKQGIVTDPILIEDDVWLGHGVVITKGIKISKGAIIGANSVVTKNIPDYAIAAGAPAKIIKFRNQRT